jgi:hypothetical protein
VSLVIGIHGGSDESTRSIRQHSSGELNQLPVAQVAWMKRAASSNQVLLTEIWQY